MSYATAQNLIDRFGADELTQLADRANTGTWDPAVVTATLLDTDAEIDAALASRYPLPLATTPLILTGIACDLTRWRLWSSAAPERVQKAADNARKMLLAFANGVMSLGLPDVSEPTTAMRPAFVTPDAVFSGTEGF
jgi:phage gp36-like protein